MHFLCYNIPQLAQFCMNLSISEYQLLLNIYGNSWEFQLVPNLISLSINNHNLIWKPLLDINLCLHTFWMLIILLANHLCFLNSWTKILLPSDILFLEDILRKILKLNYEALEFICIIAIPLWKVFVSLLTAKPLENIYFHFGWSLQVHSYTLSNHIKFWISYIKDPFFLALKDMAYIPSDLFKSKWQQELLIQNHKFEVQRRIANSDSQSMRGIQELLYFLILFHSHLEPQVSLSLD